VFLARVIGTVVCETKYAGLEGQKLLVVVPIDPAGQDKGAPLVACDRAQAGLHDRVYCVSSREASHAMDEPFVPIDAAVVGIVDAVDQELVPR
jgi:ethanolamine utilization protein EutN